MNITDETAKFLLTRNPNDWSQVYDADYPTQGSDASMGNSIRVPDLQRMARLWLMRDEILHYLSIGRLPARDYLVTLSGEPALDLFARIKALENEDEQA